VGRGPRSLWGCHPPQRHPHTTDYAHLVDLGGPLLEAPPISHPPELIGREEALAAIESFLERVTQEPCALVLSGEPGIGKTVLWQRGVERGRGRLAQVLSHRAAEAEVGLSFAGLSDLLTGVIGTVLPSLSAPRRRALEVALLLADPNTEAHDPRAIGLALVDSLRTLCHLGPVLVAVDDLQWLDRSSARALEFALRRMGDERVGLLATVRSAPGEVARADLPRQLPEELVQELAVGPLSLGGLFQLVRDRLRVELSRPQLVRLREITGGNPFFALELAPELATARPAPGRPLAIPTTLRQLLGQRLARLPDNTREVILTAAALARPTVAVLAAAHDDDRPVTSALERAMGAAVLDVDGERVRFLHPLLASVCYEEAPPWRRRAAHRRLAGAVGDDEERARHLALAAERPDAEVAAALDAAVVTASARGAPAAAAELSELAHELTPADRSDEQRRRLVAAAEAHRLAGDREQAAAILNRLLPDVPPGTERADVLFALARTRRADLPTIAGRCEEALRETGDDHARAAEILVFLSWTRLLEGRVRDALAHARDALQHAEQLGEQKLLARAIARVAMAETWTLEVTPGLLERGVHLEEELEASLEFHESPTVTMARRLMCLSAFDRARPILEAAGAEAQARGDEGTRGHVLFHLFQVEWFTGQWATAATHVGAVIELADQLGDEQFRCIARYAQALLDAHRGDIPKARAAAQEAVEISEAISDALFGLQSRTVLGFIELSVGDPEAADRHLRPLPPWLVSRGWEEPTDFAWTNAIEVLLGIGKLDVARAYIEQYEDRAKRSTSPWALATAARGRGLLAAAEGDLAGAHAALDRALAEHERMRCPFELGRTLLAVGTVRRRARQKRAARDALEQGLVLFEALGASLWAQRVRDELQRISGRRPGSDELTTMERRVASLAAQGLANKEIASALYISVHTVEAHLTRTYRKLGIRSRAALAGRLSASNART
jgi:DNA-binding CsgD family transcriptional regulator